MKKIIKNLTIVTVLALMLTACATRAEETQETQKPVEEAKYTAGVYTGEGKGFEGSMTAEVTLSETKIEDIKVTSNETPDIGGKAMPQIIDKILETQRLDVDMISGATKSSEGLLTAVTKALQEADVDVEALGGTFIEEEAVLPASERLKEITEAGAEEGVRKFEFEADGSTCTTSFVIGTNGTKVTTVEFLGDPCVGNTTGIIHLIDGMEMAEVIEDFEGIKCPGANDVSSCPDQLAKGLKEILNLYAVESGDNSKDADEMLNANNGDNDDNDDGDEDSKKFNGCGGNCLACGGACFPRSL